jgi:N-acetylmuramoyl-L-alanine amidase
MMLHAPLRLFYLLFAVAGLNMLLVPLAEAAWKTTKINDITYVPLTDCAAAFSMNPAKARKDKRELSFAGEFHQLVVKTGTRETIIDGVRHWLSFPVATNSGKAFVSLADINATLGPAMRPGSIRQIRKVKTVVLDPGHGGHDKGSRSEYGYEKDYTLDLVNRVRKILEKKRVKVVQSRLSDFFVDLSARPAMTANYKDPIFVSIHFNSAGWKPSANGVEVYALPPLGLPTTGKAPDPILDRRKCDGNAIEPASFVLANTMHHTLLGKTGSFDRGVKRARYAVLRHSDVPSILIECAFLTNPEEAKNIHSSAWREKFTQSIADGILAYMGLANNKKMPPRAWNYNRNSTDEFVWEE